MVHDNFTSPFIEALYERPSASVGCTSRHVTDDGREVHVINILNAGVSSGGVAEITVKLIPRNDDGKSNCTVCGDVSVHACGAVCQSRKFYDILATRGMRRSRP